MTATFEVSRTGGGATSHLSDQQVERLRSLLVGEAGAQRRQLAEHARVLVELGEPGADPDGVERELVGLHAARALETVEEIEQALTRLAGGDYGMCESCGRPVPFERLEVVPRARFCVACPPRRAFPR